MKSLIQAGTLSLLALGLAASSAQAKNFKELVGDVKAESVKDKEFLEAPYLTWGGDVATFYANGGKKTADGSIFGGMGLKVECVNGDNFVEQVRRYMKGETPLLRGTVRMIGIASEVLNSSEMTKPVMFMQLTWSAGDHMVARKGVATLNDLKGKKIALQQGGPHVGMLADVLSASRLKWSDVEIVWCDDLTGTPNSPAEKFRADPSIDAALVISPDMVGLCGGLTATGTGSDKTVKDCRVLVSTAQMSRSIADVYCVRKDYYDKNKEQIQKFTAGYLKACESITTGKGKLDNGEMTSDYKGALQLAQDMFGKDVIPTLEIDAHGLISDCSYVGLPGQVAFFKDEGNLSGFGPKTKAALDLATEQGYASKRGEILASDIDYASLESMGSLTAKAAEAKPVERFADLNAEELFPENKEKAESDVIMTFQIDFGPDQFEFSEAKYAADFQRAVEAASTFGNAAVAIGGHADLTLMLFQAVKAGVKKGILTREKNAEGGYDYKLNGSDLDLTDTAKMIELIKADTFGGTSETNPHDTLKRLNDLSQKRADAVRQAIIDYAKKKNIRFDPSQLKAVGVGPREPAVAKPADKDEAAKNRRVEFRLVRLPAEAVKKSQFDF